MYDLGIIEHYIYTCSYFKDYSGLLSGGHHFRLVLFIYSLIYKICPSSIILLISQAFALVLGGIFLEKIIKTNPELKIVSPAFIIILYYLYFALWWIALFDFHVDCWLIPIMFAIFYGLQNHKSIILITGLILSLCFIKEPFILTAAAFGIYLMVKYRRLFLGGILFVFCLFLFYLVTFKVIPKFGETSYLSSWAFSYLGKTPLKMCIYILSHPWAILKLIFTNPLKIIYLIALFAPFFFLCILSPLELIPALPIIAISLLSQKVGHYVYSNHHHAAIIAPVFVAFIYALPKVYNFCSKFKLSKQTLNTFLLAIALFFHIIFSCSPLSKVFWSKKLGYSWPFYKNAYIVTTRDIKIWQALKTYIPSDPKLKISYQNFLNCSYLSQRKKIFLYPSGISQADYIVLDLKRPYFIKAYEPAISLIKLFGGKGTEIVKKALARESQLINAHWSIFNNVSKTWIKIYSYDGFFIFKNPHFLNHHANTLRCFLKFHNGSSGFPNKYSIAKYIS